MWHVFLIKLASDERKGRCNLHSVYFCNNLAKTCNSSFCKFEKKLFANSHKFLTFINSHHKNCVTFKLASYYLAMWFFAILCKLASLNLQNHIKFPILGQVLQVFTKLEISHKIAFPKSHKLAPQNLHNLRFARLKMNDF